VLCAMPKSGTPAQRSWAAAKVAWRFPSLAAPPRSDRARSVGGFRGAAVNFGYRALCPHPLFYCGAVRRGPTTIDWLIAPYQGANQGIRPLGWARSTLTFSPLISSYVLTSYTLFHHRLAHRACLVTTINTIGLTATMHLSDSKQKFDFWALTIQDS